MAEQQSLWRFAPAGLLGAASLVGAYGQYQEGKYAGTAGKANAAASRAAAAGIRGQAGMAADLEIEAGQMEEASTRRQGKRFMGTNRAVAAASGFDFSGSTLDALADSAAQIELEALTKRFESQSRAGQYRYQGELQAWQEETQATLQEWQGKQVQRGQYLKAFGTILGGVGSVAGAWPSGGVGR